MATGAAGSSAGDDAAAAAAAAGGCGEAMLGMCRSIGGQRMPQTKAERMMMSLARAVLLLAPLAPPPGSCCRFLDSCGTAASTRRFYWCPQIA